MYYFSDGFIVSEPGCFLYTGITINTYPFIDEFTVLVIMNTYIIIQIKGYVVNVVTHYSLLAAALCMKLFLCLPQSIDCGGFGKCTRPRLPRDEIFG